MPPLFRTGQILLPLLLAFTPLNAAGVQKKPPLDSAALASIRDANQALEAFLDALDTTHATTWERLTDTADIKDWDLILTPMSLAFGEEKASIGGDRVFRNALIPPPDVGPLLAIPLVHGDVRIREVFDSGVIQSDEWAGVYCMNNRPVIGYAADSLRVRLRGLRSLNVLGFVFIRLHEFGHIALGHTWCDDGHVRRLRPKPEYELQADCEAAARLLAAGGDAKRVIDNVHGQFWLNPREQDETHPSFIDRARNLYKDSCGVVSASGP